MKTAAQLRAEWDAMKAGRVSKLPDCCDFAEAFFAEEGAHDYDTALRLMSEKFGIPVEQGEALLVEYDSLSNGNV